ncbi:MAG: hypothetical protein HY521_15225 [Proteobacteria bacterium]|nr:hypothetical protein [Pseudomonadota bacterium]
MSVAIVLAVALLLWVPSVDARVTRIVIDSAAAISGQPYEALRGRAFGELDPDHPLNAIITDLQLAPRNADGKVEYVASFLIRKPTDMSTASGVLWHDVPNRGGNVALPADSFAARDAQLLSGWQGDNSGLSPASPATIVPATASCLPPYVAPCAAPTSTNHWVKVPVAKNPDGSSITGRVMGRILNASGVNSQPMIVHSNPVPYKPVTLDTNEATLVTRGHETIEGVVTGETTVPSTDWAWAKCDAANPFPGTPDPTHVCVRGGFIPNRVYQVVFTTQDPPVLGMGFAAFRDVGSFFKHELEDDFGTPNPLAGRISWIIGRGSSQSGNFLRAFLHLGFNQDEAGRQVQDGNWPIIAGRRVALNFRFAMPDGVLKLYEPGSEGPQWWHKFPDHARGLPPAGILDRCHASHTCPKIIEHFGAAEIWGLKLGPEWVGTDPHTDIPLPKNVRRYYIPSTPHGGGSGGFSVTLQPPPSCPSTGYGVGTFPANPVPHTQTVTAIRFHFRNWVMNGIAPPPSLYPTLRGDKGDRNLVPSTKEAMGFPTIPGVPAWAPTGLINPVLDYDFGPEFDYTDASGVQTVVPPIVKQVIPALVPRVDADGNELGGVPVVLRDAPLGTYLGWNITAAGFHKDKICNYAGGMIPFAKTQAERMANNDPRLSLEERYGDHAGYVAVVASAAAKAVAEGFLLQADADALVAAAAASNVLNP